MQSLLVDSGVYPQGISYDTLAWHSFPLLVWLVPAWRCIAVLYVSGCSRLGREVSFASVSWCPDGVKKRGLEHKAYCLAPARSPNSQEVNAKLTC